MAGQLRSRAATLKPASASARATARAGLVARSLDVARRDELLLQKRLRRRRGILATRPVGNHPLKIVLRSEAAGDYRYSRQFRLADEHPARHVVAGRQIERCQERRGHVKKRRAFNGRVRAHTGSAEAKNPSGNRGGWNGMNPCPTWLTIGRATRQNAKRPRGRGGQW